MISSNSPLPKPRLRVSKVVKWKCFSRYPCYVSGFGYTPEEAYNDWAWCYRETVNSLNNRD